MYSILIADDEEIICKGIESKIKRLDLAYEVKVILAFSGKEALEGVITYKPDIIITDICMPDMDGLELIQQIKEYGECINYKPNFIALSAYDKFEFVREAFKLGAIDYLLKPVGLSDLREVLDKAVKEQQKARSAGNAAYYHQILLENNLSRLLVNSDIDSKILHNLIESIKEDFNYNYLCIGIIDVRDETDNKISDIAVDIIKLEKPKPEATGINVLHLCDQEHMLALLFNYHTPDKYDGIISQLSYLYHILSQRFVRVFISISDCAKDIYSIHSLYKHAYKALIYRIIYPEYNIIEYGKIKHKSDDITFALQRLDVLRQYADNFDIYRMCEVIDNVFNLDVLRDISIEKLSQLYNYAVHIINEWYSINGERDFQYKDFNEFYNLADMRRFLKTKINDMNYLVESQAVSNAIDIAIKYVKENYYKDINMAVIANIVNMNYSYFGKLFKKTMGVSFVEYLTSVRMENAKKLLKDPSNKITQISKMVGYENPKYFTRAFKAYFGFSPHDFREKIISA
ncbi:response regulator [Mahella australiensis]|uniref:Stage 0 sporulation protein A homolog n=1 Tax=Mahella australiensis (strain DSM 15567 / CIP 107919 / 50-1 BON) TaxID=697281 RepID=F3ZWS2_MAHA5|nr:response regulator [Mahella australiensis]AEE96515.1 two component transcriptional regulator, AraC family [Mahella australiensis 50-1 BON]